MNDELQKLLEQAQIVQNQPDSFHRLVEMLRKQSQDNARLLVDFAASGDDIQRRAAIAAAAGRTEPEVVEAIARLAGDPLAFVRQSLAFVLTDHPAWSMESVVGSLLGDCDANVRQAAVWAARPRPALTPSLLKRLSIEESNWIRVDIANALADCDPRLALPALLGRLHQDGDIGVQQACALAVEKHLGVVRSYPPDLARPALNELAEIRRRVGTFAYGSYPNLQAFLSDQLAAHVDVAELGGFGTVLTTEAEKGRLTHGYCLKEAVDSVLAVLNGAPPRAVVLIGESGAGKTALVHEITHRLRESDRLPSPSGRGVGGEGLPPVRPSPSGRGVGGEGAYVLRMAPQDFLAGTKYIGEWETKVRNVIAAVKPPRRVILYIPRIEELAWMGTWEKSEASVASALAPYIERGDLTILGESTAESFRKGLGANRSLRRLFHTVELQAPDAVELRTILRSVADEAEADISDQTLERLVELADYFVSGTVQPGRSVGLLRRVLGVAEGREKPISERDILQTISTSTGIPVNFLDDGVALDRQAVRHFFESRVMGQPEAVDAVVDLVTLVKAGLTDPGKPFGVFLFVGPTGVGKTELARALAEQLFGDASRLIRFDMSEFATYEAFERLIGSGVRAAEPGLLTSAVREHPFAVLLFDEIEKGHPNIYNLCLQIFDAGRLTDTQGRTADFRRTIIIMTSNVGSSIASEVPVGFGRKAAPTPDRDLTMRELGRWFRPEFLNRLDRIVNFRPLAMETAERIAQREVARVLERGGITRRNLAVEVEPAVLPLLLREGYSPAFGARPLKRTVERMVLLPVAQAIAAGNLPPGSLLRLVARQNCVEIEVEPPELAESAPASIPPTSPAGEAAEKLLAKLRELASKAEPLAQRKSELLAQSSLAGFWQDAAASRRIFDEIYRLDGILANLDTLEKQALTAIERAQRRGRSDRDLARSSEHLDSLESLAGQLEFLVGCSDPVALGDALVTLRLATRQGKSLDGVPMLARMYMNLAARRGLETQVLDDRHGGEPKEDSITLLVGGPGAFALLAGEAGVHQISRPRATKSEGKHPADRELVRVEVLPAPPSEVKFSHEDLQVEVRPARMRQGRLLGHINHEIRLFHAPTMTSVLGWCDGGKSEAVERLKMLLRARLDDNKSPGKPPLVRRYRLGPNAMVRDPRTGRGTARLDSVLEGRLEAFLKPPGN